MHGGACRLLLPYTPPLRHLVGEPSVPKYRRILVQHVEKIQLYKQAITSRMTARELFIATWRSRASTVQVCDGPDTWHDGTTG